MNTASKVEYKKIIKEIGKLAFPISFHSLLVASLQLVDNLFIGHLHNSELIASGINAINNVTFIISTIVIGLITGIGVYFTKASAKKDLNEQHWIFKTKIIWTIIPSVFLLVIPTIFLKDISSLWISNDSHHNATIEYANQYGRVVLPSLFFDFIVVIFANSYKEMKKVKTPVIIAITALIINAVLNYIFMYVLKLGISGGAYATLTARVGEIIIWFIVILKTKPEFIPKIRTWFAVSFNQIWKVFPKSFLWSINNFFITLSFTLQILFISRISQQAGTSLNSAGVFLQLAQAFIGGFAQATSILIISTIAIKNKDEINAYVKRVGIVALFFGTICGIVIISVSPSIFVIYSSYSHYINVESIKMIASVGITFGASLLSSTLISALKGFGFAKSLIFMDALFNWIIILPICIALSITTNELSYGEIYMTVTLLRIVKTLLVVFAYKKMKNFHWQKTDFIKT